MSKISIIIPAYNAAHTISDTIESVRNQSHTDWELIIIDDGSFDNTVDRVKSFLHIDKRIQIHSYPNQGTACARNLGFKFATGEYIAYLDADDMWTVDKLASQLQALQQNPQAKVAYSWAYYLDEDGRTIQPCQPVFYSGDVYYQLLINDFIISGSNCLVCREAVESIHGFNTKLSPAEDWDFLLQLAQQYEFIVVPQHQVYYRLSSQSLSSQIRKMEKSNLRILNKYFRHSPPELSRLKSLSRAKVYQFSAHLYILKSDINTDSDYAIGRIIKAVKLNPKIISESWTINLIIKAILLKIIPLTWLKHLIKILKFWRRRRFV